MQALCFLKTDPYIQPSDIQALCANAGVEYSNKLLKFHIPSILPIALRGCSFGGASQPGARPEGINLGTNLNYK